MIEGSPHFKRKEFACQCGCGFDTVDAQLLEVLSRIRDAFGPVIITSGCRCANHNAKVGGSKSSQHLYGRAADIKVPNSNPDAVYAYVDALYPDRLGLGKYKSWVHVDTRTNGPARW